MYYVLILEKIKFVKDILAIYFNISVLMQSFLFGNEFLQHRELAQEILSVLTKLPLICSERLPAHSLTSINFV